MEAELVIASSPTDYGVSCWDIHTGAERFHYKSCASSLHGLASVGGRFLVSSQIRETKSSSFGSVFYWSWNKPQVEVRSFPAESINAIVSNTQGTYIAGGGVSGDIYFWEVASGKLLKKWHAHYRAVSCLVFNDDQSLLISGSQDGSVRVWSLFLIFDDARREKSKQLFIYSFNEHSLKVTDVKTGYGGSNAIIVSASEDRTCKIWCLSNGKLVRDIVFPAIIDAISLDPGERFFYAGGKDGKIYIAGLNVPATSSSKYGPYIIGALSEHRKAITCLASSADGFLLVSGSEDGMITIWDTRTRTIVRVFRHAKGPVNNVLVIRQRQYICPRTSATSLASTARKHGSALPPPLDKFVNSPDPYVRAILGPPTTSNQMVEPKYISVQTMEAQMAQIIEMQHQPSSSSTEELEKLKVEQQQRSSETEEAEKQKSLQQRSIEIIQQWKKICENQHQLYVNEILNSEGGVAPK